MRFAFAITAAFCLTTPTYGAPKLAPAAKVGVTERVFHPDTAHAEVTRPEGGPSAAGRAQTQQPEAEPAPVARNWRQAAPQLKVLLWYPAPASAQETKQFIGAADAPLFEAGSAAKDAPFDTSAKARPLIMLSPGEGGSAAQMAWLGIALAHAGFIAAAVDHPGNNADEPYTVEGFTLWWERATDISQAIDGILADSEFGAHVDKDRIGAAGFALGGFTALQLAGAETDVLEYYDLCGPHVAMPGPAVRGAAVTTDDPRRDMDSSICRTIEARGMGTPLEMLRKTRITSAESLAYSDRSFEDDAVKAVFAIAPTLAFTLDDESLRDVHIPVEIVVGKLDRVAAARDNADFVHAMIHGSRETPLAGVNHDTFLAVCTAKGREKLPTDCSDAAGTEREAVHAQVAAMAAKFFAAQLR